MNDAGLQARDQAYQDYQRRITTDYLNPVGLGDASTGFNDARRKRTTHYDPKGRMKGNSETEVEEEDDAEERRGNRQTSDALASAYADYERRITTD